MEKSIRAGQECEDIPIAVLCLKAWKEVVCYLTSQNYQATSIQGRYCSLPLLVVGEQVCHCCGKGKDSFELPLVHHPQTWGPRRVGGVLRTGCTLCWPDSKLHGVPGTAEPWTGSEGFSLICFLVRK